MFLIFLRFCKKDQFSTLGPNHVQFFSSSFYFLIKACINTCTKDQDLTGIKGNCKAYLRCISGSLIEFICEPGYNFDYIQRKCIREKEAVCLSTRSKTGLFLTFFYFTKRFCLGNDYSVSCESLTVSAGFDSASTATDR